MATSTPIADHRDADDLCVPDRTITTRERAHKGKEKDYSQYDRDDRDESLWLTPLE